MTDKTKKKVNTKRKRPPKGQRTYIRRMKQAARKDGSVYRSPNAHRDRPKNTAE
jgi:hypothetical protein